MQELGYRVSGAAPDRGLSDPEDERAFIVVGYDASVPVATLTVDWWRLEARFVFLETSPYLVTFYERLGYRRYAPHFAYEDSGAIAVPMCLVINDHDHLARVRSPLLAPIRAHGHGHRPDVARHFRERWMADGTVPVVDPSADPVLDPHDDLSRAVEAHGVALFEGVARRDVQAFLSACRTVRFAPAQVLIEAGATDTHLLLLTLGYVEVTRDVQGRRIALATRGPGDLVGEMNMLLGTGRTTRVTALTDVEAIRVPECAFRQAARDSAVLAQITLNLARILARRLRVADGLITERPPL